MIRTFTVFILLVSAFSTAHAAGNYCQSLLINDNPEFKMNSVAELVNHVAKHGASYNVEGIHELIAANIPNQAEAINQVVSTYVQNPFVLMHISVTELDSVLSYFLKGSEPYAYLVEVFATAEAKNLPLSEILELSKMATSEQTLSKILFYFVNNHLDISNQTVSLSYDEVILVAQAYHLNSNGVPLVLLETFLNQKNRAKPLTAEQVKVLEEKIALFKTLPRH